MSRASPGPSSTETLLAIDHGPSETSTLLPMTEDAEAKHELPMFDVHDVPVQLDAFFNNIRWCKCLNALGLLASAAVDVTRLMVYRETTDSSRRLEEALARAQMQTDLGALILNVLCFLFLLVTIVYPVHNARDELKNLKLHQIYIGISFAMALLLLVGHITPGVAYTIMTHRPSPSFPMSSIMFWPYQICSALVTLLAVGSMRRGPRLQYTPLELGTGFGINSENKTAPAGGKAIKGDPKASDEDLVSLPKGAEIEPQPESNVTDYAGSPILVYLFIGYMLPLARRSLYTEQLQLSDLSQLEGYIRMAGANQELSTRSRDGIQLQGEHQIVTKWMLVSSLWKGRVTAVLLTLLTETIVTLFSYVQVISMHEIIQAFEQPDKERSYARMMCWGLFAGQTVECLLSAYAWTRHNYLIKTPVRMALASVLYNKILRITDVKTADAHNMTEEEIRAGKGRTQIINLLSNDSENIACLSTHLWHTMQSVVALVFGTYLLYQLFGASAFIGMACIPLSTPLSIYVSKKSYIADLMWSRSRDARTSAIKEFLQCYKVIKLNAFEPFFRRRIEGLRSIEVTWQRWRYTLGTMYNVLADQLPQAAILVTFFSYTKIFGHTLTPSTAFVAMTVFNRVKGGLQGLPVIIQQVFDAFVALNRLTTFLNRAEVDVFDWVTEEDSVRISDATLTWPQPEDSAKADIFTLRDVTVDFPRGGISIVCGPLGSGKTLLLRALLGEAEVVKGSIQTPRSAGDAIPIDGASISRAWTLDTWLENSVAYAPQQAYIRHGTIRDNILLGQPMWRSRYKEVLRQCSLLSDLELMPDGDLTEVGHNGITLSGGQKARINLARCVYARAKTIYLDDILSAVDAHTAQFIVSECFRGALLRDRTVVLVTHHVTLCLPAADYLVCLKGARIEQACPAREAQLDDVDAVVTPVRVDFEPGPTASVKRVEDPMDIQQAARQVYKAEHRVIGRVANNHYMMVLSAAGGKGYWSFFAVLYLASAAFSIGQALFLRHWSADASPAHLNSNLLMYSAIVVLDVLNGSFKWIWLYGVGARGFYNLGSRRIHSTLLDRIFAAPLAFFESTPPGRLMNVFASDMTSIDAQSADSFGRTVSTALGVGTSALVVCFQAPALLSILGAFGIPLFWLSGRIGKLRADLRRISSTTNSPVISLYHDAIEGIVMIRAFGTGLSMRAALQVLMNLYNLVRGGIRAIASVFVTGTGFILVNSDLSGAQIGLILSFAVTASQGLFGLLETYTTLEQTYVHAERINHYIQMDEKESTEGDHPSPEWPTRGAIRYNDVSIRYAHDLPEVLHRISLVIEPGMRVGLVGATGSGKSTLALSLFRALDPHEGHIEIDGIDICKIQLAELRARLNMVVQDGTLCSGTLREALDITGAKDDHEIYEALRRVHLISDHLNSEENQSNPFANLDTFVAVEGANFSQGQRQLLCLARALLKNSKILVMDEATSSVDFEMDAKITATIKECFANTTMLVIAHRLATIMEFDRVLVLDKGHVLEYGSPAELVANDSSAFRALCAAQGEEELERLRSMIKP